MMHHRQILKPLHVMTFILLMAVWMLLMDIAGAAPLKNPKIIINVPARTLWLYEGEHIVASYPVGVGKIDFQTPVGHHAVITKVENPMWENPYQPSGAIRIQPGDRNPLGTRWIGFMEYNGGEYGIHGTNKPDTVGKFSSHGCVRMRIPDIEALYESVDIGTPVEVIYALTIVKIENGHIKLTVYPDAFDKGMPTMADIKQGMLELMPGAKIDEDTLAQALDNASETPVVVGQVPPAFKPIGIAAVVNPTFRLRIDKTQNIPINK